MSNLPDLIRTYIADVPLTAHHLEATGDADGGKGFGDDVGVEGRPEEGFCGGQGHGRVVALMGAVHRKVDAVVASARRPHRRR